MRRSRRSRSLAQEIHIVFQLAVSGFVVSNACLLRRLAQAWQAALATARRRSISAVRALLTHSPRSRACFVTDDETRTTEFSDNVQTVGKVSFPLRSNYAVGKRSWRALVRSQTLRPRARSLTLRRNRRDAGAALCRRARDNAG